MPVFEYRCLKCDYKFEELVLGSKDVVKACCPKCGGETKKLVSNFSARGSEGKSITSSCGSCSSTNCSTCGVR